MKHTHNDVYAMRGIYEADIIYLYIAHDQGRGLPIRSLYKAV